MEYEAAKQTADAALLTIAETEKEFTSKFQCGSKVFDEVIFRRINLESLVKPNYSRNTNFTSTDVLLENVRRPPRRRSA